MAAETGPSEKAMDTPKTTPSNAEHGLEGVLDKNTADVVADAPQRRANTVPFSEPENGIPGDAASETGSHPTTLLGEETYPEGGLNAWLVVVGVWCAVLASLGVMNTMGTFQTYVEHHQLADYSAGNIGWIFSLYTALTFFCGIYIGPIFDKFGPRWLIFPGSICVVISIMTMSVYTEYWHFILGFSLLNGVGSSLLFTPGIASVGHFFKRRRGLASGIASTGGGVGGILFPLMITKLFDTMGWGWALRIQGFVCLALLVVANLLVRKRLPPAPNATVKPDLRIFRDRAFALLTAGVFLLEFALFIPLAHLSSYALANGFSPDFSFRIIPIFNAASVFGRVLPGYLADIMGPFNSNMMSLAIGVFACFVVWLPFGHTLPGLVIFAVLFGFATGNQISITPVCVGKLCDTNQYGRYYATLYMVAAVACLIGIPIGGNIVEATGGDYWAMIVLVGVMETLSLVTVYAAKASKVGWNPLTNF